MLYATLFFDYNKHMKRYFLFILIGFGSAIYSETSTIEDCIKRYLSNFLSDNRINQEEYEKIFVKWLNPEIKLLKGVNNES